MIRADRFLISKPLYAVDLSSLRVKEHEREQRYGGGTYASASVTAVWFRRKGAVTAACTGRLWDYQDAVPADGTAFLLAHADGRYGGNCKGRWDGEKYWGAERPEEIAAHLDLLRPMLESYPEIPPGFDGWWRF